MTPLWATVALYYAEYYALYSFLQKIGVKCGNHACSILAVTLLLGEEKTKTINQHKGKRLDAQYYMKTDQEPKIRIMLREAKEFVALFDGIVSNLPEGEIKDYRKLILKHKTPGFFGKAKISPWKKSDRMRFHGK